MGSSDISTKPKIFSANTLCQNISDLYLFNYLNLDQKMMEYQLVEKSFFPSGHSVSVYDGRLPNYIAYQDSSPRQIYHGNA